MPPFSGGYSPSPERTGSGDGTSVAPTLQRVFESLAEARGAAFDQTDESAVGAENMAMARAITFDLYGANERYASEMNPSTATVAGMLPRWEAFLGQSPMPGDAQSVRQARCASALARFGRLNDTQAVIDVCSATLGPLFVGLVLFGPSNAATWWPGFSGASAGITGMSGNQVEITGLVGVPTSAPGTNLTIANAVNAGNNGTFPVQSMVSSGAVIIINNGTPVVPDYGVGGTSGAPTVQWTFSNPLAPWTSTIAHVDVQVNPTAVPGYVNADGSLNGKFFSLVNALNPVLDLLLPADVTFDWYVNSSGAAIGFVLDDPNNLDVEVMDS